MLSSYLLTAARHLNRHRLYALTNICGLTVGIAGCLLVAIWVLGQLRTDRFHQHGDRIYRIYTRGEGTVRLSVPAALGASLKARAADVEGVVRMLKVNNPVPLVSHGERRFYERAFCFAMYRKDERIMPLYSMDSPRCPDHFSDREVSNDT